MISESLARANHSRSSLANKFRQTEKTSHALRCERSEPRRMRCERTHAADCGRACLKVTAPDRVRKVAAPPASRFPLADPDPAHGRPDPAAGGAAAATASTAAASKSHRTAASATASAAAAPTTSRCAAPAAAASTAALCKLHAVAELDVFLVQDIERAQVDVEDFLLTEGDGGMRCDALWQCMLCHHVGRCAAYECQRHAGRADDGQGLPTLSLRSLL
jgi:hypothetical protein